MRLVSPQAVLFVASFGLFAIANPLPPGNQFPNNGMAGDWAGWIAPLAASISDDVAFLVLFVAPAISPAEQESTRRLNLMRDNGHTETEIETANRYLESIWGVCDTGKGLLDYMSQRSEIEKQGWLDYLAGPDPDDIDAWRWCRMNMSHDPLPALEKIRCPVLALFGGKDRNVVPNINLTQMENAFKRAAKPDLKLVVIPGVNHGLRIVDETVPPGRFHRQIGFGPKVWSTVADWLLDRLEKLPKQKK